MITIVAAYSIQFYYLRERMAATGKIGAYLGVKPFEFSFSFVAIVRVRVYLLTSLSFFVSRRL